jgi:hypothetical protein
MSMRTLRLCLLPLCVLVVVACGDNKKKAGEGPVDAPPGDDAPPVDMPIDQPPGVDGIAEARAAAPAAGASLAIAGVTVTYLKPAIGNPANDPAGFTIQAQQAGPALFIAVDPATLTPAPAVGDVVSFTITDLAVIAMQPRATAITGFTRDGQGANVSMLAQSVSAATDLVTDENKYDSELVTITGTLADAFAASGNGFQKSTLNTAGITGDTNLQLRAPIAVIDAIDMVPTCQITATNVPVGRFNAATQIGAYRESDITLSACPAPTVVSAIATSTTEVRITFDRHPLASSVNANGSQFTFDNGLTASAAVVSGRTVTLTTTAQSAGTNYNVTVAGTVTDLQGSAVAAPNNDASFGAFVAPAVVRINELNANIANGCDLIELRVVAGGAMTGFKVTERTGNGANGEMSLTFPTFTVAKNDIIVVHLNSLNATCNAGGATQETASVNEQPKSTFGNNFDTAFDFYNDDTGITSTDNVITLFDANGAIIDAVFVTDDATGTAASGTETAAAAVGAASQWVPTMATYIDDVFNAAAVLDLNATGTTATGNSIQRLDNTDDNDQADWTTGAGNAATFGLINANQTPF